MKPIVAACFTLVIISCGSPGAPGAKPRVPTELIDGLQSYTSPDSVRASLPANVDWQMIEDSKLPPKDPRPRFDILVVAIPWQHSGYSGQLQLHFVNELLDSTWFFPDDPDGFFRSISEVLPSHASKRTKIWRGTAYDGREYMVWEDTALEKEQRQWIASYS